MNVVLTPDTKSKGSLHLLNELLTALFCSNRCPGPSSRCRLSIAAGS